LPESGTSTPVVTADVVLSDAGQVSIQSPWALAFDAAGNLWSSNSATSTLVEFARADLAATAAPMPAVTISSTKVNDNPSLDQPHGLCFDNVGKLTAINAAGAFAVASFAANQLVTGTPTPDTFIVGAGTTLNAPEGCMFGPLVK
jgi:hypothetical protein